jgi:hypothetical protein
LVVTDCIKCEKPVLDEEDAVIVMEGKAGADKTSLSILSIGERLAISHACCWDGYADSDYWTAGIECEHRKEVQEDAQTE